MPAFVRKLTRETGKRRVFGVTVRIAGLLAAVLAGPSAGAGQLLWHDTADIAKTAEDFLAARLGATDDRTRVRAATLDARLRLAACDRPLEGFLRAGTKIGAKTIVGVRCDGARAWKMYVPVDVVVESRVWVARRSLPRGHLLTRDDIVADVRDVSRMTRGYIDDPQQLVGQRLKNSVLAGHVLTPRLLEADRIVRRGQTVTLAVSQGGIAIRMAGRALADGALGQRIRVENLNSGRIVEGIVRSPELVEILVPKSPESDPEIPKVSAATADTLTSNNDR